jgi:hypothetical protein
MSLFPLHTSVRRIHCTAARAGSAGWDESDEEDSESSDDGEEIGELGFVGVGERETGVGDEVAAGRWMQWYKRRSTSNNVVLL